jgi:hypothetical protein
MQSFASGVQLTAIPEHYHCDKSICLPAIFIELVVFFMMVRNNLWPWDNPRVNVFSILWFVMFAGAFVLSKRFDDRHDEDYRKNITKLQDSYGLTADNYDSSIYFSVSHAITGFYFMTRDDYQHGIANAKYEITIDENKVLRVFKYNNQDAKIWVEVQPQQ